VIIFVEEGPCPGIPQTLNGLAAGILHEVGKIDNFGRSSGLRKRHQFIMFSFARRIWLATQMHARRRDGWLA
jgi:hypothetical protein